MRYDEAVKLHAELLTAAGKHRGGPIVEAVVKLHAPTGMPWAPAAVPNCFGCPPGDYAESENLWVECLTLKTLNTWFHVKGYPTGVEAPSPIVCLPDNRSFCPIHGRCKCRMSDVAPGVKVLVLTCPLHGHGGIHTKWGPQ